MYILPTHINIYHKQNRKMAIGKIDCTTQKKLCNRFNVKGYPTLKYYHDGTFNDYPLGRDKDTIM